MAWASVSVDLDSLVHYCRIHGLPESILDARARTAIYDTAVPRLLDLFAQLEVPATFFVIGEDLREEAAQAALLSAHKLGVELGNHSHRHDYALTRGRPDEILEDITQGHHALQRVVGQAPVGFRAPGYSLNPGIYDALVKLGYRYDSSVFRAAPYYLAKAGVMAALAAVGRPSRSVLDSPGVLLAPRHAYRPDPQRPYRRGHGPVIELPITVSPRLNIPFIGTLATAMPYPLVRAVYQTLRKEPHFNFELHAVDVLDADDGIPPELVKRQPDLRVPHRLKQTRLKAVLEWLKRDYDFCTLAEAAESFARR